MYKLKDYLSNGLALVNNTLRPRHKHITNLMLYTTSRCQSRCRHCHIWEKPRQDLSLSDIRRIMSAKCVRPSTTVGLEGGEFVLHPQADEMLGWFRQHHPNYTLLSNCLAPERVIAAVRQHRPLHLYVSLDGDRETYLAMRGVDGHDRVIRVIEELKGELPISIMFCLTPWNDLSDMDYCIGVARRYGIDIRIGIYGTMSFFDTSAEMLDSDSDFLSRIPRSIHDTSENFDFVALYEYWRRGELRCRVGPSSANWWCTPTAPCPSARTSAPPWATSTTEASTTSSTPKKAWLCSVGIAAAATDAGSTSTASTTSSCCAASSA